MLSAEQADWLKEVAVAFSDTLLNVNNMFTPSLLNQNLINLNNNPKTPTYDALVKANTVAIIFPFIRSQISLLTTQPGMKPIIMPPININSIIQSKTNDTYE